jgi:hypothetical protein
MKKTIATVGELREFLNTLTTEDADKMFINHVNHSSDGKTNTDLGVVIEEGSRPDIKEMFFCSDHPESAIL